MKTTVITLCVLGVLRGATCAASEPITLKLWPAGPPSAMVPKSEATVKQIQSYGGLTATRISDVSDPTITVYRPEKPNGASVIVAPGGGFMFLSYASEGTQVCEWLNTLGVTAVLLKYRTPTRDEKESFVLPVQDAQRAIGLVRHHAAEWSLDPQRVGLLGFSAGGNLAGHVAWDRGARTYPQSAELDDPRGPDFLVFIYGGGFLNPRDRSQFREGFSVPADAPPAFFLVAHDDNMNPVEAAMLYLEYKKRNLSAELHICAKGGHGFGMRRAGNPINDWPQRCGEWMKSVGLLEPKQTSQSK
jgi:acetyl esterase/lipase